MVFKYEINTEMLTVKHSLSDLTDTKHIFVHDSCYVFNNAAKAIFVGTANCELVD